MRTPLPVLVDCAPYHARLTHSACVERYTRAAQASASSNEAGGRAIARAQTMRALVLCIGCAVGEARALDTVRTPGS